MDLAASESRKEACHEAGSMTPAHTKLTTIKTDDGILLTHEIISFDPMIIKR